MNSEKRVSKFFYRVVGAHAFSNVGDSFTEIALSALVYKLTQSAILTGLVLAMDGFANLIFGFVVSSFVDRFSKKWLMVFSDLTRMGTVLCLLFISRKENLWIAYVVYFFNESLALIFNPSQKSLIPYLVSSHYLEHANNLMDTLQNSLRLIGPLLGGMIVAWFGVQFTFMFDSFTYFVSALLIASVVIPRVPVGFNEEKRGQKNALREIKEGFLYIKSNKVIYYNVLFSAASMMGFGATNFFMIYYAFSVLKGDVTTYGLMQSALGGGTILGSLLAFYIFSQKKWSYSQVRFGGVALSGLFMIMRGTTTFLPLALFTYVMVSLCTMPSKIATTTLVQKYSHEAFRGRVFTCLYSLSVIVSLISMGLGALASQFMSISLIFVICGGLILLSTPLALKAAQFEKV